MGNRQGDVQMPLRFIIFMCLISGNGALFADARMFILPAGIDPLASTPGTDFQFPVAIGEAVRLHVYLDVPAPGNHVSFYLARMRCASYWEPDGEALIEYVVDEGAPQVDTENLLYIFADTGIEGISSANGCAEWLPFGPFTPFLYANAGPPHPPNLIPFVEGVRYLGEFTYRVRAANTGWLFLIQSFTRTLAFR